MKRVSNSIGARLNELTFSLTFYCQKIKSKWQSSMPNHCTRLETQTFYRDLWKWWSECKKLTWQSPTLNHKGIHRDAEEKGLMKTPSVRGCVKFIVRKGRCKIFASDPLLDLKSSWNFALIYQSLTKHEDVWNVIYKKCRFPLKDYLSKYG